MIITIFLTYRYGVLAMLLGMVFCAPLAFIENSFYNGKLIGYSCWRQLLTLLPLLLCGAFAGVTGWYCMSFCPGNWMKLIVGVVGVGIVYMGITALFRLIPHELGRLIKEYLHFRRSSYE